jgi:hypothetical protein
MSRAAGIRHPTVVPADLDDEDVCPCCGRPLSETSHGHDGGDHDRDEDGGGDGDGNGA